MTRAATRQDAPPHKQENKNEHKQDHGHDRDHEPRHHKSGQFNKSGQLGFATIWGWPIVLGVLTSIGLISALFSDGGFGDMLAGVCLAIPVIVCLWYGWLRRRPA